MALSEYILTTQLTPDSTHPSAIVWDCKTGNLISQYKSNGPIETHCLSIVGGSHMLITEKSKPLLHVLPFNGHSENSKKIILPNTPNAICLDPTNNVLAMGIGMHLYVWMLKSGCLVSVQQKHYQPITCVRMNETCLLSGGQDGFLVVYNLSDLFSGYASEVPALYIKSDHCLPITDIYINVFGALKGRFVTCSRDQSARIYEIATGKLLLTILNPEPITAVVANLQFSTLYLGTFKGDIYTMDLKNPPRCIEVHNEPSKNSLFTRGHTKSVNSLSLSTNSQILASCSNDNFVVIWSILGRQILRKIEHKFGVTNVRFLPFCSAFKNENSKVKSPFIIKPLGRTVETDLSKHVHCVLQTNVSSFDDEDQAVKEDKMNSLQMELDQANTLNYKMYDRIFKLLKDKRKDA